MSDEPTTRPIRPDGTYDSDLTGKLTGTPVWTPATGWADSPARPVIGVIEWSSDSARSPDVFLADTETHLRRAATATLINLLPQGPADDGSINYIDHNWVLANPAPDLDDPAAVSTWLDAVREQTTDAWLTIYTPVPEGKEATEDNYTDVRA